MSPQPIDVRGEAIRQARQAQNLSGLELARKLGVTKQYLSTIESGRKGSLTLDRILEIAEAIGCDPHDLDERLASRPVTTQATEI